MTEMIVLMHPVSPLMLLTILEPSLVDRPAAPHAGISKCHAGGRSEGWNSGLGLSEFYWGSVGVILGFYWGYIIVVLLGFYWGSIGVLLGFYWGYIAVIFGVQIWSWKYVQDSWTSTCLGCGGVGAALAQICCDVVACAYAHLWRCYSPSFSFDACKK